MKQTVKQGISPFYLTIIIKHLHIKANRLTFVCKKARKRVKRYNHNLIQLLKMYEKEKR